MVRLLDPPTVRAAVWTLRALRQVHRDLARDGLDGAYVAPPPPLPASARPGVLAVTRRVGSCLERALVLQSWEAAHGAGADVVIGIGGAGDAFAAHAWLETMPDAPHGTFEEIHRLAPAGR
jgi:hypothetical protein